MQATSQAIPPTPLFYLNLLIRLNQTLKYGYHDYNQELSLSQDRVEIVGWRNTNICKEMKGDFGFTEDRQYRCSSLYQSYGQDGVFTAYIVNITQKLWVWCLERNIQLTAQHIPERLNLIADSESNNDRSLGLESGHRPFQTNQQTIWSVASGLCIQVDKSTANLSQLETRSTCSNDGCIPIGLVTDARDVCQLPQRF